MVVINIDTAKDAPEDIRKTIRYLQALVGDETVRLDAAAIPSAPAQDVRQSPAYVAPPASSPVPPDLFGLQTFDDAAPADPPVPSAASCVPRAPHASSPVSAPSSPLISPNERQKPEAERLLEEADEIEVVDDTQGAFIEIVEYDDH